MDKLLKLTRGYSTLVDEEEWEELVKYKWRSNTCGDKTYAVRERKRDEWPEGVKVSETVYLHRFLLNIHLFNGRSLVGDHINGDSLDNRIDNLRICSSQENGQNKKGRRGGSSRYKGVVKMKDRGEKWQAYIRTGGRKKHIGTFDSELDAAKAYDVFAVRHFGEYAMLNFKQGGVPF